MDFEGHGWSCNPLIVSPETHSHLIKKGLEFGDAVERLQIGIVEDGDHGGAGGLSPPNASRLKYH
jgi:hypothetical protein